MIEGVGLKTYPLSTGNGIHARDRSIDRRPRASPGVTLARARPWRPSRSPPFSVTFAPSRRRRPPSGACVCVSRASRSRAVGRRRGRRAIDDGANDRERVARSIGRDLDDARRARGASAGTSEGCFETREFLFTRVSLASRPRARVVDAASSTRSRDRSAPRERTFAGDAARRSSARRGTNGRRLTTRARRTNDRSTKPVAARAGLNEFAEKVSKGALSLGVAGAVLAQVRGVHSRARDTTAIR